MGLEERKQSKEIGDTLYEVTPVPFGVGRAALVRLVKKLSPVMSSMLKEESKQAMTAAVLEAIPGALDESDLKFFSNLFGPYTTISKSGVEPLKLTDTQQELHFAGGYLEYIQWLVFACEVNFGGFFTGIIKGVGNLPAAATK